MRGVGTIILKVLEFLRGRECAESASTASLLFAFVALEFVVDAEVVMIVGCACGVSTPSSEPAKNFAEAGDDMCVSLVVFADEIGVAPGVETSSVIVKPERGVLGILLAVSESSDVRGVTCEPGVPNAPELATPELIVGVSKDVSPPPLSTERSVLLSRLRGDVKASADVEMEPIVCERL